MKINDIDQSNIKIVAIQNIPVGQTIGVWITIEPMSNECRYLFQE
jgi:hypothetical protein